MLDVNIEFSKGILFVRLSGVMNNKTVINIEKSIISILMEGGIKNLVFNVDNLKIEEDVDLFNKCKKLVESNNGKMIICGLNENLNINLTYCEKAPDELAALRMMNVC